MPIPLQNNFQNEKPQDYEYNSLQTAIEKQNNVIENFLNSMNKQNSRNFNSNEHVEKRLKELEKDHLMKNELQTLRQQIYELNQQKESDEYNKSQDNERNLPPPSIIL